MNCLEFRRICSTEPARVDPVRAEHMAQCQSCAAFAVEMESFDHLLQEAFRLPVPLGLRSYSLDEGALREDVAEDSHKRAPPFWMGLAAGVVLAAAIGFGLWTTSTPSSLGGELVAHIEHEPASLRPAARPVGVSVIDAVLQRTGVRLEAPLGKITYIKTCPFRGRDVAHVVIEGSTGPVTLMLLPEVNVDAPTPIDEQGYRGTIVPLGGGSVAIIGGGSEPLEPVEELVSSAVAWSI